MKRPAIGRFLRCFLFWMIVFHWWLVLFIVPGRPFREGGLVHVQVMLYVWTPTRLFANVLGPAYFAPVEFFGPHPCSPVAWGLVALFWVLVIAALALITSAFIGLLRRKGRDDAVLGQR